MSRHRLSLARRHHGGRARDDAGFMMVAILIGMGVAAIMMTAMLPSWRQQVQRQREEELIFRGEQYARAIALYYVKHQGAFPPSIDVLVSERHLRKKWKDPITNDNFALIGTGIIDLPGPGQSTTPVGGQTPTPAGTSGRGGGAVGGASQQPGIQGVQSKSTDTSIKIYQQQQQYNLWQFTAQLIAPKMGINLNAAAQQGQGGRGGQGQGGRQGGGVNQGGGRGGRGGQPAPGRGGATGPGRGGTPPPGATPPTGTTGRGRGGF